MIVTNYLLLISLLILTRRVSSRCCSARLAKFQVKCSQSDLLFFSAGFSWRQVILPNIVKCYLVFFVQAYSWVVIKKNYLTSLELNQMLLRKMANQIWILLIYLCLYFFMKITRNKTGYRKYIGCRTIGIHNRTNQIVFLTTEFKHIVFDNPYWFELLFLA